MQYKHIQAIHELRMWIILTATGAIALSKYLEAHPEAEARLHDKIESWKCKLTKKPKANERIITIRVISDSEGS